VNNTATRKRREQLQALSDQNQQRSQLSATKSPIKDSSSESIDTLAHPYYVIKQNSNETNSSFNVDSNDLSIDAENKSMLNATVIENPEMFPKRSASISDPKTGRILMSKRELSADRDFSPRRPQSENLEKNPAMKIPQKFLMNVFKESSSTSTEENFNVSRKTLPSILVQDEIAKLSQNIQSSTEDSGEVDVIDEKNVETIC
jgi:hypothetical protein